MRGGRDRRRCRPSVPTTRPVAMHGVHGEPFDAKQPRGSAGLGAAVARYRRPGSVRLGGELGERASDSLERGLLERMRRARMDLQLPSWKHPHGLHALIDAHGGVAIAERRPPWPGRSMSVGRPRPSSVRRSANGASWRASPSAPCSRTVSVAIGVWCLTWSCSRPCRGGRLVVSAWPALGLWCSSEPRMRRPCTERARRQRGSVGDGALPLPRSLRGARPRAGCGEAT